MERLHGVVADVDDGALGVRVLERTAYFVKAGVRARDEADRAQRQRDGVHHQPPPVTAVTFHGATGDGHMAQRWEY